MRPLAAEKHQPTLPSALADAGLALALTSVRVSTLSHAVWDVTGLSLPVGFTLAVHRTSGVPHATLAATRAVVGTRVHPGWEERGGNREGEKLGFRSGTSFSD